MATRTVSFVGFNRALIAAKEDVGPETSSAKQSCFGSALSRSTKVFLGTFVTIDKNTPAEQRNKKHLHCLPTKGSIKAKFHTAASRNTRISKSTPLGAKEYLFRTLPRAFPCPPTRFQGRRRPRPQAVSFGRPLRRKQSPAQPVPRG